MVLWKLRKKQMENWASFSSKVGAHCHLVAIQGRIPRTVSRHTGKKTHFIEPRFVRLFYSLASTCK